MTMLVDAVANSRADQPETMPGLDYEVAIAGGGLVGLTLAAALKHSGLRVLLLEAKPESMSVARGQAYHVNLLASRILHGIGVWERMQAEVTPIHQIRLSDADDPGVVDFRLPDLGTEALGYVTEHRVLLEGLQQFVQTCENVTVLCPAELVQTDYGANAVTLMIRQGGESRSLRTKLLVAADGLRSPIRQQAGIQTQGWQYPQSCVVAFIQPEKSHRNIAYERFWSSGPFAILPLPDNLCRIVWTAPRAEAEAILAMDDADFLHQLKQRYGDQMGELSLVGDRFLFNVQLMHSHHYARSRLALVGDAAHGCHPVGGQGVNMGFRDAAALAQVITTAHQQGQDIGSLTVLQRYERWRQLENLAILGVTDVLVRLFSNNWLPLVMLRRLGLRILQTVPPMRVTALKLMTGLLGRPPKLAQQ